MSHRHTGHRAPTPAYVDKKVTVFAEILSWEILVPMAIIALLFGGAKIPELARSLGGAKREFEKASRPDEPSPPNPT